MGKKHYQILKTELRRDPIGALNIIKDIIGLDGIYSYADLMASVEEGYDTDDYEEPTVYYEDNINTSVSVKTDDVEVEVECPVQITYGNEVDLDELAEKAKRNGQGVVYAPTVVRNESSTYNYDYSTKVNKTVTKNKTVVNNDIHERHTSTNVGIGTDGLSKLFKLFG